jgi:hypothetical protein
MNMEFYLITVVHCKTGLAKHVADLIFDETCIFEKMIGDWDSVYIFTDSKNELFEDDKILLTEIILEIAEAVNHRHFKTNRYTSKYA